MQKPAVRPANPCFGSGPTSKRPGWSVAALEGALLGRSHRSAEGKRRLVEVCERSRRVLGIPADYRIGIIPGSDTGAFECAMWTLAGERGVDVLAYESFGEGWLTDAEKQLRLSDLRPLKAAYGELPDLAAVERARRNLGVVEAFVDRSGWAGFLAAHPGIRSPTSVCLTITDPAFTALDAKAQQAFVKDVTKLLAEEKVAYDIASYRDAPAGLR